MVRQREREREGEKFYRKIIKRQRQRQRCRETEYKKKRENWQKSTEQSEREKLIDRDREICQRGRFIETDNGKIEKQKIGREYKRNGGHKEKDGQTKKSR